MTIDGENDVTRSDAIDCGGQRRCRFSQPITRTPSFSTPHLLLLLLLLPQTKIKKLFYSVSRPNQKSTLFRTWSEFSTAAHLTLCFVGTSPHFQRVAFFTVSKLNRAFGFRRCRQHILYIVQLALTRSAKEGDGFLVTACDNRRQLSDVDGERSFQIRLRQKHCRQRCSPTGCASGAVSDARKMRQILARTFVCFWRVGTAKNCSCFARRKRLIRMFCLSFCSCEMDCNAPTGRYTPFDSFVLLLFSPTARRSSINGKRKALNAR
jgi:hypothetical protein